MGKLRNIIQDLIAFLSKIDIGSKKGCQAIWRRKKLNSLADSRNEIMSNHVELILRMLCRNKLFSGGLAKIVQAVQSLCNFSSSHRFSVRCSSWLGLEMLGRFRGGCNLLIKEKH